MGEAVEEGKSGEGHGRGEEETDGEDNKANKWWS